MTGAYDLPPGPRAPEIVQTLNWLLHPVRFMERSRERYGELFTIRIRSSGHWVFVCDPEHIKQVFTGNSKDVHTGEANAVLRPVLGGSSTLTLDEDEHLRRRKLVLPQFHGERMQRYGEAMAHVAHREMQSWPVGEPFTLWPHMRAMTLEMITRTVFGVEEADRMRRMSKLLGDMLDGVTNSRFLARLMFVGPDRVERSKALAAKLAPVHEAVLDEVARRRAAPDLQEREDILSMLVQARYEDGSPMSDAELLSELKTLLVAGHDTTTTELSWAFERLLRHPDKLERVREEALAGESAYVDAVVKETLRQRPVFPIAMRKLTKPMEIGGYALPAGMAVRPCIYLMHHNEEIYPEAERFLPERFLERPPGTYTWIPFGGGVRRCIGASFALFEMRTVLQAVVTEFDMRPADERSEAIVRRSITMAPQKDTEVIVTRRRRPAGPGVAPSQAPVAAPA
jgi:cytochrome P450